MEKKQWKTERPIGLFAGVEAVEKVCEMADIYRAIRQKPPHFVLTMEDRESQSVFTKYVAEMYREHGVMDFFELDDFVEFSLDGSFSQLEDVFNDLKGYAVYSNDFQGIVAMDITKLAEHLHETQLNNFLDYVKAAEDTVFLFYISMKKMNRNGANLVHKVVTEIPNTRSIEIAPYTAKELSEMILQMVEESDIIVRKSEKEIIMQMIQMKVEACGLATRGEAKMLARQLMLSAEVSHDAEMKESKVYLDAKKVSDVCGERKQSVDKENENYAK